MIHILDSETYPNVAARSGLEAKGSHVVCNTKKCLSNPTRLREAADGRPSMRHGLNDIIHSSLLVH